MQLPFNVSVTVQRAATRGHRLAWLGLLLALALDGSAEPAPAFALRQWGSERTVRLADFAGKVVVLDFFAYWCGPCDRASRLLREQIQDHYSERGGNPQGVAVEVVAVNVEPGQRVRTEAFIRRHGFKLVLDDDNGKTLAAYGGRSLPFVVVLDGKQGSPSHPSFDIAYRGAGLANVQKLRRAIDRLGARVPTRPESPASTGTGP